MAAVAYARELEDAIADREMHELVRRGDPRDRARVLGRRPGVGDGRRSGFRGIGGGGGGAAPAWDWLTSLPSAALIYDTSYNKNGATTSQWNDRATATSSPLIQATGTAQPTWSDADATFGGKPSQSFDGGDHMAIATAADAKFMHDGTGCTYHLIFYCNDVANPQMLMDNTNFSGANPGVSIRFDGTGQTVRAIVTNGAALICDSGLIACARGAVHIASWRYKEGSSPEWSFHLDGTLAASGSSTGAPSAANPSGVLRVGRRTTTVDQFLIGKEAVVAIYNDYHSDAQIAQAVAAARAGWGVP